MAWARGPAAEARSVSKAIPAVAGAVDTLRPAPWVHLAATTARRRTVAVTSGGGGGLAYGGGGGGVVRLVAANVITIGDGSAIAGVDAGACGGKGARGAGGGGSGGQIRLEAPFVQMNAMGTLAANGGGGGGNLNGTDINGQPGQLNASISFGAGSTQVSSLGGNGGAGDAPAGTAPATGCGVAEGMGGGGSAGRLQILAKGGAPNIHAQAVLSPSVPTGAATIGSADVH